MRRRTVLAGLAAGRAHRDGGGVQQRWLRQRRLRRWRGRHRHLGHRDGGVHRVRGLGIGFRLGVRDRRIQREVPQHHGGGHQEPVQGVLHPPADPGIRRQPARRVHDERSQLPALRQPRHPHVLRSRRGLRGPRLRELSRRDGAICTPTRTFPTPSPPPTTRSASGTTRTLFEKAGVDVPTDEWTWDDLHDASKNISEELADDGVYGFAGGAYNQELFYNLIFQAGGDVLNDDSTKAEYSSDGQPGRACSSCATWSRTAPRPSIQTTADTSPDELFKSGKAAMVYGGSFRVAGYVDSAVGERHPGRPPAHRGPARSRPARRCGRRELGERRPPRRRPRSPYTTGSQEGQEIIGSSGASIPAYEGTEQAYIDAHPEYDLGIFPDVRGGVRLPVPGLGEHPGVARGRERHGPQDPRR